MQTIPFQVSAHSIGYTLPEGKNLFSNISFSLTEQKYGLIGNNGVGKSTLGRILSGQILPTEGSVYRRHEIHYFAQFEERKPITVAEYLQPLWESSLMAASWWNDILSDISMEDMTTHLSGGQWTRVRLLRVLALEHPFYIFDEPTNNLDQETREQIQTILQQEKFAFLLISHDTKILECVNVTLELSNQGLTVYGGNFNFYESQKKLEKVNFEIALDQARKEKKKDERELEDKIASQEKRNSYGAKQAARGSLPKILLGNRKSSAEKTAGKVRSLATQKMTDSQEAFNKIWQKNKIDNALALSLPDPGVPSKKLIFQLEDFNLYLQNGTPLWAKNLTCSLFGATRLAIAGKNGAGKSTLVREILGIPDNYIKRRVGRLTCPTLNIGYLDQSYSILDEELSVLENVQKDSTLPLEVIRNNLAHFQFYSDHVHQKTKYLSGGEKLKAALAKILFANPPPQLLILDEPTNNLDLGSVEALAGALSSYKGALIVISHDIRLIEQIGVQSTLLLER